MLDINDTAQLNGTVTDEGLPDPPASLTLAWVTTSGPATATFGDAGAATTTVTFSGTGGYRLGLTTNDGELESVGEITVAVNQPPVNVAAVVSAGADQNVFLGQGVSLNGTVADDGLPNAPGAVTTTWSKFSGPGTVTFGHGAAVDTTATFSVAGTYVLRLTADDGERTTSDDVTITVSSSVAAWAPFMPGGGGGIMDVVPALGDTSGLIWYCGCDVSGGPFRSRDGGKTWTDVAGSIRVSSGAFLGQQGNRNMIASDPTDVNRVYVAFLPMGCLARGVYNHEGVYRSDNQGDTWTELTTANARAISRGTLIVDNAGRVFGFPALSTAMYVSSDHGNNFTQRTAPFQSRDGDHTAGCGALTGGSGAMIVSCAPNNRIFYADPTSTTKGVWRTDNQGVNWIRITSLDGRACSDIACHPNDNNRILAAMRNGSRLEIWVSSNNGTTFTKDTVDIATAGTSESGQGGIAINHAGVALAWPHGAFRDSRPSARSTSNGDLGSWSTFVPSRVAGGNYVYQGNADTNSHRFIASPAPAVNRWVACNLTNIIISEDNGATWKQYARGIGVINALGLVIDSTQPNVALLISRDVGMARTANGGITWTDVNGPSGPKIPDTYGVAQDPTLPTRWYRVRRNPDANPQCVFEQSLDRGINWTTLSAPPGFALGAASGPQISIIVDPNNANVIYVGWAKTSPGVQGLYKSNDRGANFSLVANSTKLTNVIRVGRNLYGFSAFESSGTGGKFLKYNMDTGAWRRLGSFDSVTGFAVHPNNDQIMWVCDGAVARTALGSATKGKLFKSMNGGSSWTLVQRNGKDFTPHKIYIDPNNTNVMLMASYYEDPDGTFHGIQFSKNAGVTWTDLPSQLPHATMALGGFVYGGVPGRVYGVTATLGVFRLDGLY